MTISRLPLSYCTNVHPGRTVSEVIDGLTTHTAEAMRHFNRPLGAGLWLARSVVSELLQSPAALEQLGHVLWQHDLHCCTFNAFPFGDFHSERVKERVYLPDWTTEERAAYTLDCARILAQLLPRSAEGSLSTVPLGGTMNPTPDGFSEQCIDRILTTARSLQRLEEETGRRIRLAIEPEPLCHLSSIIDDTIPWFCRLFQRAADRDLLETVREYVGVCLDVCHQAVVFEDVRTAIAELHQHDIRINKLHITSAVECRSPSENDAGRRALQAYVEPRYLHQTFAQFADGHTESRPDLTEADICRSPPDEFLRADRWRVHFHVPIFAETLGPLQTTRETILSALQAIRDLPYAPHLEVETYTWPVMPDAPHNALSPAERIARELEAATHLIAACDAC